MKLKNYAYRCMAVVCAIVAVSCVDEEFSMDKVSKEVSVIDGKTVLPIGSLEKVSLGDLLGSETELPEGIIKNEDGSYELFYELPAANIAPDGFELPTSFDIAASSSSFNIDLPSLDFSNYGAGVEETFGLNLPLGDSFKQLLQSVGAGTTELEINSFMLNYIPEDQRKFATVLNEEVEIDEIKFDSRLGDTDFARASYSKDKIVLKLNKILFLNEKEYEYMMKIGHNDLSHKEKLEDYLIHEMYHFLEFK